MPLGGKLLRVIDLRDNPKLIVTYGIYEDTSSSISDITIEKPVAREGKYIIGGRLIIVKDGQLYDVSGKRLINK